MHVTSKNYASEQDSGRCCFIACELIQRHLHVYTVLCLITSWVCTDCFISNHRSLSWSGCASFTRLLFVLSMSVGAIAKDTQGGAETILVT